MWLESARFRKRHDEIWISKIAPIAACCGALLLVCQPAFAEKRVALVLGNSAYQNVPPLTNPVNDGGADGRRR